MLFIGIDLGTSACKFLLMDEAGRIENVVNESYPAAYPHPGWSEQDPEDWWDAVKKGIPELLSGFDAQDVKGIGCGGQMHGLVALDAHDRVVRPAILWNDGRTADEVSYLNNEVGTERLLELTGNIAYAGFTAPKLLWMAEHEPELFAEIAHIMLPKDYVVHMLTGAYSTDVSDASGTLLFDVAKRAWSEGMLEICHVDEDALPEVHESADVAGTLLPSVAKELGLPSGIVVCAGAGDNAAAAVGTGTVGAGTMNISLGTSGTVFIPTEGFSAGVGDRIHSFCHADGGWHLMGCILSAASCNQWWLERMLGTADYAGEQKGIDLDHVDTAQPYFLPYLMGERTPLNDVFARGCFIGLRPDTSRQDMTRAVLEGVSFAVRDSVEIARSLGTAPERSMVCGGGAKSPLWLQMLANILGIALTLPETEQGPGYGGAMLAAVAAGRFATAREAASAIVRVKRTVEPDGAARAAIDRRYAIWQGLYPALRDSFRKMGEDA